MATRDGFELPWLKRLLIFGRRPPALTRRQWTVMALLSGCGLFSSYDAQIFTLALPQIQQDLGISDKHAAFLGSFVALGPLLGFPLLVGADRFGRKVVLLLTVMPFSVLTGLTAMCNSALTFGLCQLAARIFISAEHTVSNVVVVEEMPKHCRGWAVGVASACATIGNGLAILGFGLIGKRSGSWRMLYAAAVVPLLFLASFRRFLPETERFEEAASQTNSQENDDEQQLPPCEFKLDRADRHGYRAICLNAMTPFRELFRRHQSRASSVFALSVMDSFSMGAHSLYDFKYLQDAHGFSPQHVTVLGILGGLLSLSMYALVGEVSDRLGRRKLLSGFYALHCMLTVMYYLVPPNGSSTSTTRLVCILWTARIAIGMGMGTLTIALFTEIFPTLHRSTAQSLSLVGSSVGKPLGIFVEGLLVSGFMDTHWRATALMASMQSVCAGIAWSSFPETAGLELEEIEGPPTHGVLGQPAVIKPCM